MNWREDLLFNRIDVKLKCAVFILSNIFSRSDILNFETKLFPIVPPAKIELMQIFQPKVTPAAQNFCVLQISREEVILDKRANLPRRLNLIKVKRTTEEIKANIALPHREKWKKKGSLTGKKSSCKEAENFFPSGKKQLFALKLSKRN